MLAPVREPQARPDDQVLDRARGQHLARARERADACADVHRDAAQVLAPLLAFAGVHPGADLEPERADGVDRGQRALRRPCRPVEGGEEAVAGRLHLSPAEACSWVRMMSS